MNVDQLLSRHPTRWPIIMYSQHCVLRKHKFLVPKDCTLGEFTIVLRSYIEHLRPVDAIFIFIDTILPSLNATIHSLYKLYAKKGILHLAVETEDVFG